MRHSCGGIAVNGLIFCQSIEQTSGITCERKDAPKQMTGAGGREHPPLQLPALASQNIESLVLE